MQLVDYLFFNSKSLVILISNMFLSTLIQNVTQVVSPEVPVEEKSTVPATPPQSQPVAFVPSSTAAAPQWQMPPPTAAQPPWSTPLSAPKLVLLYFMFEKQHQKVVLMYSRHLLIQPNERTVESDMDNNINLLEVCGLSRGLAKNGFDMRCIQKVVSV